MPIRPSERGRYPADWPEVSRRIRFERAAGRCECLGECGRRECLLRAGGRCRAVHEKLHPDTHSRVILTVAHLDHRPENCDPANLRAYCQACHLHYDRGHHAETRRRRHNLDLFEAPTIN